ncbi:MAG: VacJ family lipoprotein [Planctomycetes bacterium]|nr:VacJ family lipoprotein [Planctomycetota bacterium]
MNSILKILLVLCLGCSWSFTYSFAEEISNSANTQKEESLFDFNDMDFEDEDFEEEFEEEKQFKANDPLEKINRPIYWFNSKLYKYIFRPLGKGYLKASPKTVRNRISSFFINLKAPLRGVNCALQGKFRKSCRVGGRFLINSTIGLVGLYDPALKKAKMQPVDEDFGQTLGHWGVGPGWYIQFPLSGPSNIRDFACSPFNYYFDGKYYLFGGYVLTGLETLEKVNSISTMIPRIDSVTETALDPYLLVRDGYLQLREKQVQE